MIKQVPGSEFPYEYQSDSVQPLHQERGSGESILGGFCIAYMVVALSLIGHGISRIMAQHPPYYPSFPSGEIAVRSAFELGSTVLGAFLAIGIIILIGVLLYRYLGGVLREKIKRNGA
jgi:hypothetical protein